MSLTLNTASNPGPLGGPIPHLGLSAMRSRPARRLMKTELSLDLSTASNPGPLGGPIPHLGHDKTTSCTDADEARRARLGPEHDFWVPEWADSSPGLVHNEIASGMEVDEERVVVGSGHGFKP